MSKVAQFIARHPEIEGYDLINFLESYARLVNIPGITPVTVNELLTEGLDDESIAKFYTDAVNRLLFG